MSENEIYFLIEKNKSIELMLRDYGHNKLSAIVAKTPQGAIDQLKEMLPNFKGYKKIEILGKNDESTPWTKACSWQMEYTGSKGETAVGMPTSFQGIGALDYIDRVTAFMQQNFELQKQNMELNMKINNNDPAKWMPIISMFAPVLGIQTQTMAGPAGTSKLVLGDVEDKKMTDDEIGEEIGKHLQSLATKIKGSDMLKIVKALDKNNNWSKDPLYAQKISKVLNALIKNPGLIDSALNFIS